MPITPGSSTSKSKHSAVGHQRHFECISRRPRPHCIYGTDNFRPVYLYPFLSFLFPLHHPILARRFTMGRPGCLPAKVVLYRQATSGCPVQAKFIYKRSLVIVYIIVGINGLFYLGPLRNISSDGNTFRRSLYDTKIFPSLPPPNPVGRGLVVQRTLGFHLPASHKTQAYIYVTQIPSNK